MALEFTTLNWVAVIAAGVAGGVVGAIWYLPMVFGKRWAANVGRKLPSMSDMTPTNIVAVVVMPLLMAYVLTLLLAGLSGRTAMDGLVDGVIVGFVVWLGFTATVTLNAWVYDGRNFEWWWITSGFHLVAYVIMGAIIGYLGA